MKRKWQYKRYRYYRDSDGVVLKVDMADTRIHLVTTPNGIQQECFYMRPCWRNGKRCEISTATLTVLPEVRKRT